MKKKCPECGGRAVRLYRNQTIDGVRKWVSIAWMCCDCKYVYTVAGNTLVYKMGSSAGTNTSGSSCPKCEKSLVKAYRHLNPKDGKQQWVAVGSFCPLCNYVWLKEQDEQL